MSFIAAVIGFLIGFLLVPILLGLANWGIAWVGSLIGLPPLILIVIEWALSIIVLIILFRHHKATAIGYLCVIILRLILVLVGVALVLPDISG
ncbi:MAG: hypothetical protein ABIC95_06945 [archaeon]